MKIHRFVGPWQLAVGRIRIDDAGVARQMRVVLHLEVGEQVVVADGTGLEAQCTIAGYQSDAVVLECTGVERNTREPACHVTLFLSILKADHFESACRQAAEVGVYEIVPVVASRTVKHGIRVERIERIVREAAEVAGRAVVPRVHEAVSFDDALSLAHSLEANVCFDTSSHAKTPSVPPGAGHVGIWIGPEGGWHASEIEAFDRLGIMRASLGSLVLRADTAAAVGVFLVAHRARM
jgi:16S rRNA (uracil1498-N3)-methyltransferase